MFGKFLKGISFIEIAVLVAVLFCLIALTVPKFGVFKCRSKQSEARFELARIHAAEKLYQAKTGTFTSLEDLFGKQRVHPSDRFYRYQTRGTATAKTFVIEARGKNGSQIEDDVWTIDQDKNLVNEANACVR